MVNDAETCRNDDLIPAIQMKMARMDELCITPDHFPHWELQLARQTYLAGDLQAWVREKEGARTRM